MKYTFQFRGIDKQVLETRSSESQRHIILKILAYILYYDRTPRIELRVSEDKRDYRPDVVAFDRAGEIALWVDCGQIAIRKLENLTRQLPDAEIVVIKSTYHELASYAREAHRRLKQPQHIEFLGFDSEFVPALVAQKGHLNSVDWQRENGLMHVSLNAQKYSTRLWRYDTQSGKIVPDPAGNPRSDKS